MITKKNYLSCYLPDFAGTKLPGTYRTYSNCHSDICPGNICPVDIYPYQEYLNSY